MEKVLKFLETNLPLIHELVTVRLSQTLIAVGLFFIAVQYGFYAIALAQSENLITQYGPMIGGDFVVFYEASLVEDNVNRAVIYDFDKFNERLNAHYPDHKDFGLGWQYPPTMYLYLFPLAALPYMAAFALWTGGALLIYSAFARHLWQDKTAILLVAGSPIVFHAVITGQTGFLTGLLLAGATLYADKRPLLAGLAAGLLAVKPQLGLLLPLAFLAGGCWRAFLTAGATAIILAITAYGVFGMETWTAFIDAVNAHGDRLDHGGFPIYKLVSIYGGLATMGLPAGLSFSIQIAATLALGALTVFVWRKTKEADIRFALISVCALLAMPYAFYYELPAVALGVFLMAKRASKSGWLPGEAVLIGVLYIMPFTIPGDPAPAFPTAFAFIVLAFFVIIRRATHDLDIRFSIAKPRLAPGS